MCIPSTWGNGTGEVPKPMILLRRRHITLQLNSLKQHRYGTVLQREENMRIRSLRATAARRDAEVERDRALELTLEVLKRKQQDKTGGTARRLTSGIDNKKFKSTTLATSVGEN